MKIGYLKLIPLLSYVELPVFFKQFGISSYLCSSSRAIRLHGVLPRIPGKRSFLKCQKYQQKPTVEIPRKNKQTTTMFSSTKHRGHPTEKTTTIRQIFHHQKSALCCSPPLKVGNLHHNNSCGKQWGGLGEFFPPNYEPKKSLILQLRS